MSDREDLVGILAEHLYPGQTMTACESAADAILAAGWRPLSDPAATVPAPHHAGASDTEKAAAWAMMPRAGTLRAEALEALVAAAGSPLKGYTDAELAKHTGRYLYSIAPRRTELAAGGWIEDSGRRRDTPNGHQAIVWVLTAAARARLGLTDEEAADL